MHTMSQPYLHKYYNLLAKDVQCVAQSVHVHMVLFILYECHNTVIT